MLYQTLPLISLEKKRDLKYGSFLPANEFERWAFSASNEFMELLEYHFDFQFFTDRRTRSRMETRNESLNDDDFGKYEQDAMEWLAKIA